MNLLNQKSLYTEWIKAVVSLVASSIRISLVPVTEMDVKTDLAHLTMAGSSMEVLEREEKKKNDQLIEREINIRMENRI
ncbi:hypothetical protein LOK49_LG04G02993 [Camellia lanceoleosa]|uniref:Uncharacterized protein n=1 Tax=Camellia lanceoleosa TaxID=1840588 RepID=A0ACC0I1S1_9ERIC|nr:hypothetical protein LOK49_LG04G02993 [Camellia lanceoleosa]